MDESWLLKGPSLEELVVEVKDQRKPWKRETAVVIPTYRRKEILKTHIERLASQTLNGFDIIIIYDQDDEFIVPPPGASVLHIRERGANGSAGGFYTGQGFALAEGYRHIILADDDTLPESDRLLERITELLEDYDVVVPRTRFLSLKTTSDVIHLYGAMRRGVLEKVGLTFLPLYLGGEDLELMDRIRRDGSFSTCVGDGQASHPVQPSIFLGNMRRAVYYARGNILRFLLGGRYFDAAKATFIQIMLGYLLLAIGRGEFSWSCVRSPLIASRMGFFRMESIESETSAAVSKKMTGVPPIDVSVDESAGNGTSGTRVRRPDLGGLPEYSLRKLWSGLGYCLDANRFLGKNVMFLDACDPLDFPVVLLARRSFIMFKGEAYEISKERAMPSIMLSLVLVAGVVPLAALLSVVLTIRGIVNMKIKGISSHGYRPRAPSGKSR